MRSAPPGLEIETATSDHASEHPTEAESHAAPRPRRRMRMRAAGALAAVMSLGVFATDASAQKGGPGGPPPTYDFGRPTCDEEALESPPMTCDGPWAYKWKRMCNDPAICGYSSTCAVAKSCFSYFNGISTANETQDHPGTYTFVEEAHCNGEKNGDECQFYTSGPEPWATCSGEAAVLEQEIRSWVPATAPGFAVWEPTFGVLPDPVTISGSGPVVTGDPLMWNPYIVTETTTYRCRTHIANRPFPAYGQNLGCGCQSYQPNQCACEAGSVIQATAASNAPAPTSPGPGKQFDGAPKCTTCDEPDFHAGTAQSMFDCLTSQPPKGDGMDRVVAAREARLKLLLQLTGDSLPDADRTYAEDSYLRNDTAPKCQEPLLTAGTCPADLDPEQTEVLKYLQLCKDLGAHHVPLSVASLELDHCLDQLQRIELLPAPECRDAALAASAETVTGIMRNAIDEISSGDMEQDLVTALTMLDAWYEALDGVADPAYLRQQSSALATSIWKRAHDQELALPWQVSSDTEVAAMLADVSGAGLEVDWTMLRVLFGPAQPIDTPPLLFLVADALRGTFDRMEKVTPVHDVACRFAHCEPNGSAPAKKTALAQAWRALASLGSPTQLASALDPAGPLAAQQPQLFATLQAVSQRHARLSTAWSHVEAAPLSALADGHFAAPTEAEDLAAVMRAATARSATYQATGSFGGEQAHLSAAVLKQHELVGFIDYGVDRVHDAASAYDAARLDTVNDLLAQTRTAGDRQSVLDRAEILLGQAADYIEQLQGLREREATQQRSIADFMSAFESVVESGAFDADAAWQVDVLPPREIGPTDAHFQPGSILDLNAIHASMDTIAVGEILDIEMTDATWTPTCALDISEIAAPSGDLAGIDVGGAVTGPEGYYLTWSNGSYDAKGFTGSSSYFHSHSSTWNTCVTVTTGGPGIPGSPISISGSVSNCVSTSNGFNSSQTTNNSNGDESRLTASFNAGIRLPITPIRTAPVGSLLAVITAHGQPHHIVDARVVNRKDSIHVPALPPGVGDQVDIHLVVNDVDANCTPPADDTLQLQMRVVTPAGVVAKAVGAAMAQSIAAIEAEAPSILAQGGLTGADATELRASAWANLTLHLAPQGVNLAGLPVDLRNLFEAWLEKSLASISRRGEIDRVQRELDRLRLEAAGLAHDLESTEVETRLQELIPRWRLRDLAGTELEPAVATLGSILADYSAPIFELRDPAKLGVFRTQFQSSLNALLAVDFAAPMDEAADALRLFALDVRDNIQGAQFDLPTTAKRTVVLAFPRSPDCDGFCPEFAQAPEATSKAVWRAVEASPHIAELPVSPADLFKLAGGNSRFACQDQAPVVRRAGVYMLNPFSSADLAAIGRELPATAGASGARFSFPQAGGMLQLTADDTTGVQLGLPVINGAGGDVTTKFNNGTTDLGAGAGISPFSTFTVDFGSFWTEAPFSFIDETQAILLVMDVERRMNANLSFVPGVCQLTVAP